MISRTVVTSIPPNVVYSLTPLGLRVARELRRLADVLEATTHDVPAARTAYDSREDASV